LISSFPSLEKRREEKRREEKKRKEKKRKEKKTAYAYAYS